jgi:hypothetical protein
LVILNTDEVVNWGETQLGLAALARICKGATDRRRKP